MQDQALGQVFCRPAKAPDGSAAARLTSSPGTDQNAAWSPDGKKLAFWSDRDGNAEIYSANADGTGQVRLTITRST